MNALTDETAEPPALSAAKAPSAPRDRIVYDDDAGTAVVGGVSYSIGGLSDEMKRALALRGMASLLRVCGDRPATYAAFRAGRLTKRDGEVSKPRAPSLWSRAAAMAMVEHTKKSLNPLSLEAASARVGALPKKDRIALRSDPLVIKHHSKLTGKTAGGFLATLLGEGT